MQMARRRFPTISACAAVAGAAAVLAAAPGAVGSPAASACTFGGIRYAGTTSQQKPICLTLSTNRKIVREYVADYVDSCGTGTVRAINPVGGVAPILKTGAFAQTTTEGYLRGVARKTTVSGTLRRRGSQTIPGKGTVACDTGIVRWTARRAGA
jgi:hypothetical protein